MAKSKNSFFTKFAKWIANATGKPVTFIIAASAVIIWGISGPVFGFSDTWQLIINTSTTIITFLMVFLIQNTQNRDTEALQLKIDELVCAIKEASDKVLDLEELDDKELDEIRARYEKRAKEARAAEDAEKKANN